MRIYIPAVSRLRLAFWLSQKDPIPGFDRKRWGRFLQAQEDTLYPAELMLLSLAFAEEELQIEGELEHEPAAKNL